MVNFKQLFKITMKKSIIIIVVALLVIVGVTGVLYYKVNKYFTKLQIVTEEKRHQYDAEKMFQDQQVIEFCNAAEKGDIVKMDELLKKGVGINTEGKSGITPFLWLLKYSKIKDEKIMKKSFNYFVDKKANPLKLYHWKGNAYYTVLHFVSTLKDSYYLKTLLKSGVIKNIDFELPENSDPTPLLQAYLSDRFENFKILLDYGADMNKETGIDDTPITVVAGNFGWRFAYELLQRGADYKVGIQNDKIDMVGAIEGLTYHPSAPLNYYGIDYRQKCVEFLEDKGYEIYPDMPAAEKYIKENGKYVLYVNEKYNKDGKIVGDKDNWVLFEESSRYEKPMTKEDREKAEKEEGAIYEVQKAIVN